LSTQQRPALLLGVYTTEALAASGLVYATEAQDKKVKYNLLVDIRLVNKDLA
jgi:hypothetical protein